MIRNRLIESSRKTAVPEIVFVRPPLDGAGSELARFIISGRRLLN